MSTTTRSSRPLLLLTSFEAFGGSPINPTIEISQLLAGMDPVLGSRSYLTLPVIGGTEAGSAWSAAKRILNTIQPDAVVALGESAKAECVHVETRAVNIRDSRIPDNAGSRIRDEVVIPGGPDLLFSTLPATEMVGASISAGVPARLSNDAGTFLCNELMFRLLHHEVEGQRQGGHRINPLVGFIHVPQHPDQARMRGGPSMDPITAARSVQSMLQVVLGKLMPTLG